MSFADNLKLVRKEKNITQEELAEILDVSRQAISKWESGTGYPETEKLILISKELDVSLDYLLLDEKFLNKERDASPQKLIVPSGKISISSYDDSEVVTCQAVKYSTVFKPGKDEPKYILNGIYGVSFWGDHTVMLGFYEEKEEVTKEMEAIKASMDVGNFAYKLQFDSEIELTGFFQIPKFKR